MMTACDGQAKNGHADRPRPVVSEIIETVRATGTIDVKIVERVTGVTLHRTGDSNAAFIFYKGQGVRSGKDTLGVDLRMPVSNGGATSGALVALTLTGKCSHRADVEAHYGPLILTQAPRGDATDEEAQWSRREPWGELSFGFPTHTPDCLRSVVFTLGASATSRRASVSHMHPKSKTIVADR